MKIPGLWNTFNKKEQIKILKYNANILEIKTTFIDYLFKFKREILRKKILQIRGII